MGLWDITYRLGDEIYEIQDKSNWQRDLQYISALAPPDGGTVQEQYCTIIIWYRRNIHIIGM
jgi:hypothetical protein